MAIASRETTEDEIPLAIRSDWLRQRIGGMRGSNNCLGIPHIESRASAVDDDVGQFN